MTYVNHILKCGMKDWCEQSKFLGTMLVTFFTCISNVYGVYNSININLYVIKLFYASFKEKKTKKKTLKIKEKKKQPKIYVMDFIFFKNKKCILIEPCGMKVATKSCSVR